MIELFASPRHRVAVAPGQIRCHVSPFPFGLPDGDDVDDVLRRALTESSEDFPLPLRRVAPQLLLPLRRDAAAHSRRLFNGPSWKVVAWSFSRSACSPVAGAERGYPLLCLEFRPTNWYTFAVTNMSLGATVIHEGRTLTVRDLLAEGPLPLASSRRANSLAVHVQLVVRWRGREYVVFGHRGPANANNPGTWSGAASGGVDPRCDLRPEDGSPDPARAALRELVEELALEVDDARVHCLAFVLKEDQWQPVLVFAVEVERDPEDILAAHARRGDGEVDALHCVPLDPVAVEQFLAGRPLASTLRAEVAYLLSCLRGGA